MTEASLPPVFPVPSLAPIADAAPKFSEEPVVWIHHWNPSLMSLRVRRDPSYRFVPGQFARIGLKSNDAKEDGEIIWRAYSIVSAPNEAFLEFFLVVVPTGAFSARVAKLKLGDTMLVDKVAQGFLTADRFKNGRDLWLMATGTGLAPYISMVRDGTVSQQFENIVIVQSVRERADLAYVEELTVLSQEQGEEGEVPRARLQFVNTLTRDHLDGALQGRIPTLITSGALETNTGLALTDENSRFMLCGNPEMVEGMRALLKAKGFRMNRKLESGHIIVENYW
jgi:ferredoxin/flavodoxin---NADP+ reductase